MEKENEKIKGDGPIAELVKVPSQYELGIRMPDGSIVNHDELLVQIYNEVRSIKKSIG